MSERKCFTAGRIAIHAGAYLSAPSAGSATRFSIAAIALLSGLIFGTGALGAAADKTAAAPTASEASAKPKPDELPSLAEILTAAEAHDSAVQDISRRLQDRPRIDELAGEIDVIQKTFDAARYATGETPWDRANVYELADLQLTIRRGTDRLAVIVSELTAKARALDADLDQLADDEREWRQHLETARTRNAPQALQARIEAIVPSDA